MGLACFFVFPFSFLRNLKEQSKIPPPRITELSWGTPTPSPTHQEHAQIHASTGYCEWKRVCRQTPLCWPPHAHVCTRWDSSRSNWKDTTWKRIVQKQGNMDTGRFPKWVVLIWVRTGKIIMVRWDSSHILIIIFCNLLLWNDDMEGPWN